MTLGQLSVWRDIQNLPPPRWHEANAAGVFDLPPGVSCADVEAAMARVEAMYPSLRTRYRLADPVDPRQLLMAPREHVPLPLVPDDRAQIDAALTDLAARSFDISAEHPWRAAIVASGTSALRLLFAKHHIAADGGAVHIVRETLVRVLAKPGDEEQLPVDLIELAHQQRSAAWQARRDASIRHFTRIYAVPPARFVADDPAAGSLQGTIESAELHDAVHSIAEALRVSPPTVLIAAYAAAVATVSTSPTIRMGVMSSNRFSARLADLVTSLNQTTAFPVDTTAAPIDLVRAVGTESLKAYRTGIFDVDSVTPEALGAADPADQKSTCMFNYISDAAVELPAIPTAPGRPQVHWNAPFSRIGARCYLRAFANGERLHLQLRTSNLPKSVGEAVLLSLHDWLLKLGAEMTAEP